MLDSVKKFFKTRKQNELEIMVLENGFSVIDGGKELIQIDWSQVLEIFAFKIDLLTTDCICLGFRISNGGDYFRVSEEMQGYRDLVKKIGEVFPDHDKEWWSRVAFPAFATNYTRIWGKAHFTDAK